MNHDRAPASTTVIVVAIGALRRAAWSALLVGQPGVEVAGTTAVVADVARLVPPAGPTTVLLDGSPEAERVSGAVGAAPGAGVLALLDDPDVPVIVQLLRAGAIGCLPADASAAELIRAIVAVGRGEIALPAGIAARALAELARPAIQDTRAVDALSEREREVVEKLAMGYTNKDIAQELFLSVRTVEAHLRSIYAKLGVRSRTEAVLWAIKQDIGFLS